MGAQRRGTHLSHVSGDERLHEVEQRALELGVGPHHHGQGLLDGQPHLRVLLREPIRTTDSALRYTQSQSAAARLSGATRR